MHIFIQYVCVCVHFSPSQHLSVSTYMQLLYINECKHSIARVRNCYLQVHGHKKYSTESTLYLQCRHHYITPQSDP